MPILVERNFAALSAFRIAFATYLLADFVASGVCCYQDFYGAFGVSPAPAHGADLDANQNLAARLIFAVLEGSHFSSLLLFLYPAAIIAFGLGYRTRLSTITVFVLNSYLHWRNPYIIYGADILARLLLLWSAFLPLNRHWSIDAALDRTPPDRAYPAVPFLAIRLQLCSVYVFAALIKLSGGPWRDGNALLLALSDNLFGGTPAANYLVIHYPELLYYINYAVVAFQLVFPLLVFCPWKNDLTRGIALSAAACMHISFIFCLNIGSFPFISLIALLVLVPDAWLERLRHRLRFLPVPGVMSSGFGALRRFMDGPSALAFSQSMPRPIAKGHRRSDQGLGRPAVVLCAALVVLAFASNVDSVARIEPDRDKAYSSLGGLYEMAVLLQVAQRWYLFAPVPSHFQRRYRFLVHAKDGTVADLMSVLPSPIFRASEDGSGGAFLNHRWLKFFTHIDDFSEANRLALGRFLCRLAGQRGMAWPHKVRAVEVVISKQTVERHAPVPVSNTIRFKIDCEGGRETFEVSYGGAR